MINLVRLAADKKDAVLGLLNAYASNCKPNNIAHNTEGKITALIFEDESIMQDLQQDLTQLCKNVQLQF